MEFRELIIGLAGQVWIYPLIFAFCTVDGVFPILPSETAIVALSALSASTGEPNLWILGVGSAAGAILGDNIAYIVGHRVSTARFRWMRRRRVSKAFEWARQELDRRGGLLILTARYIPAGRVAVNLTAGATHYPRLKFFLFTLVAGMSWAAYSVAIGLVAGAWVHRHPLLGVILAILLAIVLGWALDKLIVRLVNWRDSRDTRADTGGSGQEAARREPDSGTPRRDAAAPGLDTVQPGLDACQPERDPERPDPRAKPSAEESSP